MMPTAEMAVAPLANQIKELASSDWTTSPQARYDLIAKAEKLIMAAREPGEELRLAGSVVCALVQVDCRNADRQAINASIRSAIALGAFNVVPADGTSISVGEVASKTGTEEKLLGKS